MSGAVRSVLRVLALAEAGAERQLVVDSEELVRRMEAEALLTPEQAQRLLTSLAAVSPAKAKRRMDPARLLIWSSSGLLLAGIVTAALLGGGPSEVQDVAQTLNLPQGHGEMNRTVTSFLALGLLLVLPLLLFVLFHNSLVAKEEKVAESWAQIESNFQRRADLIPALVETVSRYLRHERETLGAVVQARSQPLEQLTEAVERLIAAQEEVAEALRSKEAPPTDDQKGLERLFAAQRTVGGHIGEIFAVAEAYPDLRSSDQFHALQAQIEGTENRINVARQRFNAAVGDYNGALRMLPWNLVAALGGFSRKAYFRSEEEAGSAPALAFD